MYENLKAFFNNCIRREPTKMMSVGLLLNAAVYEEICITDKLPDVPESDVLFINVNTQEQRDEIDKLIVESDGVYAWYFGRLRLPNAQIFYMLSRDEKNGKQLRELMSKIGVDIPWARKVIKKNKTHPRFDAFNKRAEVTSPVDCPIIGIYVPYDPSEPIDEAPSNLNNLRTFISTPFGDKNDYVLIRTRTSDSNHSVQRLLGEIEGIKAYYAIKHMSELIDCFYIVSKKALSYQELVDICDKVIGHVSGIFQVR